MRISQRSWLWLTLAVIAAALVWSSISLQHHKETPATKAITDLSVASPLNQPGGGMAPVEAYEIYSSLYQAPMQEPLVFAEDSVTDIPQVNGSCLKPSTPQEREMADAFVIANQQSHRWEQKLTAPNGYRLLPSREAAEALASRYCAWRDEQLTTRHQPPAIDQVGMDSPQWMPRQTDLPPHLHWPGDWGLRCFGSQSWRS